MEEKTAYLGNFGLDKYLKEKHDEVQNELVANPHLLAMSKIVDEELELINRDLDIDTEISDRWRKAGFTPSDAYDILRKMKGLNIGQIEKVTIGYKDRLFVLTPFKTVIPAQEYIDIIQKRLMTLSSVSAEDQIFKLQEETNRLRVLVVGFHRLTFFGHIKLAFNKLFKGN